MAFQIDVSHRLFDLDSTIEFYNTFPFKLHGSEDKHIYIRKSVQKEGRAIFDTFFMDEKFHVTLIEGDEGSCVEIVEDIYNILEYNDIIYSMYLERFLMKPKNYWSMVFYYFQKHDTTLIDLGPSEILESIHDLNTRTSDIIFMLVSKEIMLGENIKLNLEDHNKIDVYKKELNDLYVDPELIRQYEAMQKDFIDDLDKIIQENFLLAVKIYREQTGSSLKSAFRVISNRENFFKL